MRLLHLPAYSPDLNPIEEFFSCLKARIRRDRDYVLSELSEEPGTDPYRLIWEHVYSIPIEYMAGWYKHSNYL